MPLAYISLSVAFLYVNLSWLLYSMRVTLHCRSISLSCCRFACSFCFVLVCVYCLLESCAFLRAFRTYFVPLVLNILLADSLLHSLLLLCSLSLSLSHICMHFNYLLAASMQLLFNFLFFTYFAA